MANLYVTAVPPTDLNRNTEWFMYPEVWTIYILILFFCWLLILSLTSCSPGMAWTVVNLSHFLLEYEKWLVAQSGLPPFEQWREKMGSTILKFLQSSDENWRDMQEEGFGKQTPGIDLEHQPEHLEPLERELQESGLRV